MQSAAKRALEPSLDSVVELPPHGRLPRLDLGVDWESPWQEFRTSIRDFFDKTQVPTDAELPRDSHLRAHWIRGKTSSWAFVASSMWHVIVVVLLILPIWGFLPATARNLSPVRVELTWTPPAEDLPKISLPAAGPKKPALPASPKVATPQPDPQPGADAFHPRQTILSIPVRVTHPRQTLIRPDAPQTAPKIEPELPNIVQWASAPEIPKLQMQIAPSTSAPKMQRRVTANVAAPEIVNSEKNSGPLNIASGPAVNPQPQMPMAPMSASVAQARRSRTNANTAAPEVGAGVGDANLRSVIALSASPAPPAPEVAVPAGNSAARVAISPEGTRPGSPNGTGTGKSVGAGGGGGGNAAAISAGGTSTSSLPASVSVGGGSGHATTGGGIGSGQTRSKLLLKPAASLPERPQPMTARRGPANVAALGPNEPPETILSGKEVYTLDVNLPNVTSASGSWILNFAQLDEDTSPFNRPKGTLSSPVATHKVDPKYPPDAIKQNIEGEVVLYAIIRADGSVDSIQLVRKLDPLLDQNAVQALAQWKFRPATREGSPVDIEAVVHIPFKYHSPDR
jgi:TonB family protein